MFRSNKDENKAADLRRFKLGGYGVLVCVIAIAIVVIVCLIVDALPSNVTKIDLSENDIYEVSDDTEKFLADIDKSVDPDMKVKLYLVSRKSQRDTAIDLFLRKYAKMSGVLSVDYVDPEANPDFVKQYAENGLSENSVIAVSAKNGKTVRGYAIDNYSLYEYAIYYNGELYAQLSGDEFEYFYSMYGSYFESGELTYKVAFTAETQLATAVDYVTAKTLPTIYSLEGHGEPDVNDISYFNDILKSDNISLSKINLATSGSIPEDCNAIAIIAPSADISSDELDTLKTYSENGGNIIFISFVGISKYPNLTKLCESFDLSSIDSAIIDPERHYAYNETIIVPEIIAHEITASSLRLSIGLADAHGIEALTSAKCSITNLLETSDKAYILQKKSKDDTVEDETDADSEYDKVTGKYCVAALSEKSLSDGKKSSFLWIASPYVIADQFVEAFNGNGSFITGFAEYITGKESSVTMEAKSFSTDTINIESAVLILVIGAVICVVIPLAFIIAGIVISVKRRKR